MKVYRINDLLNSDFPEPKPLIGDWLHQRDIVMIYGEAGIGKSLFTNHIAIGAASGCEILGKWSVPSPMHVVYIDGEMREEALKSRFGMITKSMSVDPTTMKLDLVTNDHHQGDTTMINLLTREGQEVIEPLLQDGCIVIIDNYGTLVDLRNSIMSWETFKKFIVRPVQRNCTIIIVHHPNKSGQVRGTGKMGDDMFTTIRLDRPSDYVSGEGARFIVNFEKSRMHYGEAVKPFEACLATDGNGIMKWTCRDVDENNYHRNRNRE